jgi:hypothetical protein
MSFDFLDTNQILLKRRHPIPGKGRVLNFFFENEAFARIVFVSNVLMQRIIKVFAFRLDLIKLFEETVLMSLLTLSYICGQGLEHTFEVEPQ